MLQDGVSPLRAEEVDQAVDVWEASVRATHHFVTEADIDVFRPLVRQGLPQLTCLCVRDSAGAVAGFIAVEGGMVHALFIDPAWRGQGAGSRLLRYAIDTLQAAALDVNEQNPEALGFYRHMGFEVVGRSPVDGLGKPYPLLHMRLKRE